MTRTEIFKNELDMIKNPRLKEFASYLIENADDYFFTMPASTSGKYHPVFDLGEGGLVRHTKVVVFMANSLATAYMLDELNTDIVIIAALVHDIKKLGDGTSEHTVKEHPLFAYQYVHEMSKKFFIEPNDDEIFSIAMIADCVLTHMGQWSDWKPSTGLQFLVHSADYIASRKDITGFNFK